MATVNDTDTFLVNRNGSSYQLQAQNLMAELQDTDLMLVNRNGVSYKAQGSEIKESFGPLIATPVLLTPADGATDVDLNFTATATPFSAEGGRTHKNSDWQIATDIGFGTIVLQSMADTTNKTSWTVPDGLEAETTYYVRVRYRANDDKESGWSNAPQIVTEEEAVIGDNTVKPGVAFCGGSIYGDQLSLRSAHVLFIMGGAEQASQPFAALGVDDNFYQIDSTVTAFENKGPIPAVVDEEGKKTIHPLGTVFYAYTDGMTRFRRIRISDGATLNNHAHPNGKKWLTMRLGANNNAFAHTDEDGNIFKNSNNQPLQITGQTIPIAEYVKNQSGNSGAGIGFDGKLYKIAVNFSNNNLQQMILFPGYENEVGVWKKVVVNSQLSGSDPALSSIHAIKNDGSYVLLQQDASMSVGLQTSFPAGEKAIDILCTGYSVFVTTASGKCFQGGANPGDAKWYNKGPYVGGTAPTASTWAEIQAPNGKKFQKMTEPCQWGHLNFILLDA